MALSRGRKAFTLIELMVVIVILGILAAIAVVGYGAVTDRATAESVEATATSFDREYRALLAFGDSKAAAAASTASDFGGSATVAADSSTVEFSVNGDTGCLTLSAAPKTASTYAAGDCA